MKVLLIGGTGFVGLNLAEALVRHGHEVHIAARSSAPTTFARKLPAVSSFHLIKDMAVEPLMALVQSCEIDCVVALASSLIPSSSAADFDRELTQTIVPTFRLMEQLARQQVRFVYVSSGGTVYGASTQTTLDETTPLRPISHYGYSKLMVEQYVELMARTQGLQHMILRPSNPFGPFQNPHRKQGLVAVAVEKMLHGQPIEIWGDGSVVRDYLWVQDLAEAVARLLVAESAWGQTFNIGAGVGHSIIELLDLLQQLTGISADIRFREGRAVDVQRMVLNISKLRSVVPFEPLELREALSRYLDDLHR
ncbi:NAD-dependent epimerase/dehydratase family protein [Roseateles depolymerans]|uniref:NAD-dependent epimerase/dehydratase family protein n=1 Tax=Roseateles depolymerans TaxID=76731 RepID=A0A0U3MII8_9BURK|nr:NAD-dependent epimerase/dehydratase family protein [Roseateles depolymerans]ALV08493.1 NAD-dependent epimerase/dehydratase family protein [Roseateles depolymerans]REG21281.1 UDP-glucose 4-epimerase [Roseateles depolymerans]